MINNDDKNANATVSTFTSVLGSDSHYVHIPNRRIYT